MRVDDLTVEVRDRTLKRVGQVTPRYLNLKGRTKWCGVGEWTLTLPGDHPMVPYLAEPGSGLLVTGPDGAVAHPATYTDWEPITWDQHVAPAGSFTRSGVAAAQGYIAGTEIDVQPGQVIRASVDWDSTDPDGNALFGLGAYKDGAWDGAGSGATNWGDGDQFTRWIGPVYSTNRDRRVKHYVVPEGVTRVRFSNYRNAGSGSYTYTVAVHVVPVDDPDIRVTYLGTPPTLIAPANGDSALERRTLIRGPWRETTYGTLFSGPTRTPTRVRNQENPDGTYTFSGVTDEVILQGARAFPNPAVADPQASSQSKERDARTGKTEALLRQFVAYNIASTHAPAGRLRGLRERVVLASSDHGRGLTQTKSPRFQNLLELLQEMIAYDPSLGFRLVQVGGALEFQVLDARDRTAFVRFDVENGTIVSEEVQTGGPVVTDAIVAGQGGGTARTIVRRQTPESIAAEAEWGVVFENFIDQRDTDDLGELQQSGDEALLEGSGGTAVKMVPADDMTMQVNVDWRQGDAVTTVVSGIETVARVTEVAYSVTSSGVMAGAALGDVSGFTQQDAESSKVQSIDSRVSNLERSSAGPVDWARIINEPTAFPTNWGTVSGKPTSFPSTWATVSGKPESWGTITQKPSDAVPADFPMGESVFFSNGQTGYPSAYGTVRTTRAWSAGGGTLQFWTGYNSHMGQLYMRQYPYPSGPWTEWKRIDAETTSAGVMQMTAAAAAPSGWLLCDGGAVSRTTYAALFAAIGTTYGAGNGSSTFNLPNLKGRVPVGLDSAQAEFNTRGKTGGAKTHTLTEAEMPSHAHTHNGHSWAWGPSGNVHVKIDAQGGSGSANQLHTWQNHPGWDTVNATGGGGAHNNLQPYTVVNYIIKT